jgi:hypothetical protein
MKRYGTNWTALALAALATPAWATGGYVDFESNSALADPTVDQACWGADCGEGCCDDSSCGDACCGSEVGCGSSCGSGGCCLENCGLFGLGYLTYDGCSDGCGLPELLLGSIACPSEHCYDDFISPMTNPVYFEDPRNVTELRGIFIQHKVPAAALGGDVQLYALQIRARLTERLSLIATKDGYVVSDNPLIDDGWADLDIGLKYALYRDPAAQQLLSAGFTYNIPMGTPRTQQARGDGIFNLFLTGGAELFDCGHWLSGVGGLLPVDDDANSSFVYWSNHFDYQVRKGWYGLLECNWYHWAADGDNRLGLTGLDGGDLFNLGSAGVEGNDIVTGAFGGKYKPNRNTEIGLAYEVPLTDRRDVLENRLTADLILRY